MTEIFDVGSGALTLGNEIFCSIENGCKRCPVCKAKVQLWSSVPWQAIWRPKRQILPYAFANIRMHCFCGPWKAPFIDMHFIVCSLITRYGSFTRTSWTTSSWHVISADDQRPRTRSVSRLPFSNTCVSTCYELVIGPLHDKYLKFEDCCTLQGSVKCLHCQGTGFRAAWMEPPTCST